MIQAAYGEERVSKVYQEFLEKYFELDPTSITRNKKNEKIQASVIDPILEKNLIEKFLTTSCSCGRNCQLQFSADELMTARAEFCLLSTQEKNCYILGQLRLLSRHTDYAISARTKTVRKRQKFEYKINSDRIVCRDVFLFFHGETIKRLKRLQECLSEHAVIPPEHGNTRQKPSNAYSSSDRELVKLFIENLAENQGLPDPGRDVRKGKGHLRILLPSIMNYTSIHQLYEKNIAVIGSTAVGYQTFLKIWQEEFPYVEFNNPKTDLCMTCENFKKNINQLTSSLDENKEELKIALYKSAVEHLNYARKERIYYKAHSRIAKIDYEKIASDNVELFPAKANSRDIIMGYSWDFAQQLQFPFEDQQVGPIYFKTPRRSQLFGVCCEGSFRQTNYLIDESDFLSKNANTVISLLDHFFSNYGLGERSAYFTADNCVGQNKNNALIQYLMYRICSGLHDKIELSFLAVGHTKFSPDSHFGLIRQRYRKSGIYTYEQLANVIEESTGNGYNICHTRDKSKIVYRDWTGWLSAYFKVIPNITRYHHFRLDSKENGIIIVKKNIDSKDEKIDLTKGKNFVDLKEKTLYPETILHSTGLSAERQWYLYDHIREHIPSENDKNKTCPQPICEKPKAETKKADS